MEAALYSPLIDVKTYQEVGEKQIKYTHIKKTDFDANYNEAGLLLVAGLMLERKELDLLIINDIPFTQENMRTKGGRFVWNRYSEISVNAYNQDILRKFIKFADKVLYDNNRTNN